MPLLRSAPQRWQAQNPGNLLLHILMDLLLHRADLPRRRRRPQLDTHKRLRDPERAARLRRAPAGRLRHRGRLHLLHHAAERGLLRLHRQGQGGILASFRSPGVFQLPRLFQVQSQLQSPGLVQLPGRIGRHDTDGDDGGSGSGTLTNLGFDSGFYDIRFFLGDVFSRSSSYIVYTYVLPSSVVLVIDPLHRVGGNGEKVGRSCKCSCKVSVFQCLSFQFFLCWFGRRSFIFMLCFTEK